VFLLTVAVRNLSTCFSYTRKATALRLCDLSLEIARVTEDEQTEFSCCLLLCVEYIDMGDLRAADAMLTRVEQMRRDDASLESPHYGETELRRADFLYHCGDLTEQDLALATARATEGRVRWVVREIHRLRGAWRMDHEDWPGAIESYSEALRMARDRGLVDESSEAGLVLAKLQLGSLSAEDARDAVRRLPDGGQWHLAVARIWRALGDRERAVHAATATYRDAWGQGEPFVSRRELDESRKVLMDLGAPVPDVPSYDPATDPPFPWEADVRALIDRLRAEEEED